MAKIRIDVMTPQQASFIFWRNIAAGVAPIAAAVFMDAPLWMDVIGWIAGMCAILAAVMHAVIYHRVRRHWEDYRPR